MFFKKITLKLPYPCANPREGRGSARKKASPSPVPGAPQMQSLLPCGLPAPESTPGATPEAARPVTPSPDAPPGSATSARVRGRPASPFQVAGPQPTAHTCRARPLQRPRGWACQMYNAAAEGHVSSPRRGAGPGAKRRQAVGASGLRRAAGPSPASEMPTPFFPTGLRPLPSTRPREPG